MLNSAIIKEMQNKTMLRKTTFLRYNWQRKKSDNALGWYRGGKQVLSHTAPRVLRPRKAAWLLKF